MLKKCSNGHSFDDQENTFCPECPIEGINPDHLRQKPSSPRAPEAGVGRASGVERSSDAPAGGVRPKRERTVTKAYYPGLGDPPSAGSTAPRTRPNPVVGWLVAHDGPALGQDFRIHWGNNAIGRDPDQHISVAADETIHGREHAFVVYDPKSNRFYIRPGTQPGLVHLNGDVVMHPMELSHHDRIGLGESEFTFVPLCDGQFWWTKNKEEGA
jgi:hypothetical protein